MSWELFKLEIIMLIYCCGCGEKVNARLTNGVEVYSHREDLYSLPFWKCDTCKNFVGCHHKTKDRTRPLGCIPTQEIKNARKRIHSILDPIWKNGHMTRKAIYEKLSRLTGRRYHTANIRTIDEARKVYKLIKTMSE